MVRKLILAVVLTGSFIAPAMAEDMIVGAWTTQSGETAQISGNGSYTIKLKTGKHAGKTIGSMSGSGGTYKGTITDPADDKTYSGSARISGSNMRMKGCVAKILCKSQTWKKQG